MDIEKIKQSRVYIFLDKLIYKFQKDNVTAIGAQLAYYLILSIFPFIIFLLNILSFTPIVDRDFLRSITAVLPIDVQEMIFSIVAETVQSSNQTLLSIGAITGIWAASRGVMALIQAINRAYEVEETRSYIELRLLAVLFTLALLLLITFVMVSMVFGQIIGKKIFSRLNLGFSFLDFWYHFRILLAIIAMIIVFALLYRFSPSIRNKSGKNSMNINFVNSLPGAIFTSIGWIITSIGFSFYVNNFGNYSKTYGSLGAIIALLVWLYISSIIIVMGGEINAVLNYMRKNT